MSQRFSNPAPQYFYSGTPAAPLSGGLMYFYESGTSTPKDTYSDNGLSVPNTNPVVLSSSGVLPNVFLDGSYRVTLTDKNGVQQPGWPRDSVNSVVDIAFAAWDTTVTYGLGGTNIVYASNGDYYVSIQSNNTAHEPSASPLWWTPLFDYLAAGQTIITAGYVTIGDPTTGLAGVNINAKGTLLAGNGAIPAALSVGSNTFVLTADSAQTLGIKWAAVPSSTLPLLATLTPTASANVQSLNLFSSIYDEYLIIGNNIKAASDASLLLNFAVAGSAVTSASYATASGASAAGSTGSNLFDQTAMNLCVTSIESTGFGANFAIRIKNANGAAGALKSFDCSLESQSSDTDYFRSAYSTGGFAGAAITGFRLSWSGAANFAAQGSVRVYGLTNS